MKGIKVNFLFSLTTALLIVANPGTCDRLFRNHPRGKVPYPKTLSLPDPKNPGKYVTLFMESAAADNITLLYSPESETKYYLEKKGQTPTPVQVDLKRLSVNSPEINTTGKWYIGVHGWWGWYKASPIIRDLVEAIQKYENANIIHVDWEVGAAPLWYPTAVDNAFLQAKYLADVIHDLVQRGLAKLDKVHLIGFSLGGQLVGLIGQNLFNKHGWKLKKITSLDPAGPEFDDVGVNARIDPGDAEFIEVYHTCGDKLGYWRPAGHVDIYVNTGQSWQPGCDYDYSGLCSHQFSKNVYGTYTHLNMTAYKCTSFEDYAHGHCNDDLDSRCTIGFKFPDCKEGVYHVETATYFNP